MFMNFAFKIVSFFCISGKTEENDEQVIEVKQKIIKLESMRNEILWFLKILYFVNVLLLIFCFPGHRFPENDQRKEYPTEHTR